MNYSIINSSSKGNCIIIDDILAIDIGVAYVKIKQYLSKVKLIYISHVHKDHLLPTTITKINYNYPTIKFITSSKEVVKKLKSLGVKEKNIFYLDPKKWYSLGILEVKTEPLMHDVENYALKWKYENKKGIYIVDTSNTCGITAKDYDLYLIEANYKEELLEEHIKNCSEEEMYYLSRVPHTHLSYEKANEFLINNMGKNSEYQYIHQSKYNFKEEDNTDGSIE